MYNHRNETLTKSNRIVRAAQVAKSGYRPSSLVVLLSITALVVAVILPTASVKAETYTLDQCLNLAQSSRASIVRSQGVTRSDDAEVRRQFARLILPTATASYSESENRLRDRELTNVFDPITSTRGDVLRPDENTNSSSFSLSARYTLFDGLSNYHDYKGIREQRSGNKMLIQREEQNVNLDVKIAYFAYLANVRNLSVQEEAVKRSREQLNLVQSKYDVGSASLSDVLKQKVQFGNDNLTLLDAQNSVETARSSLAYKVGLDPASSPEFDTTYVAGGYDGSLQEALSAGLSGHPELGAAEFDVRANSQYLKSSYGAYLPRVTLSASRSWSDNDLTDDGGEILGSSTTSTRLGFDVSMSIFDGLVRERSVVGRKIALNNSRASEFELRNRVISDIRTNYLGVEKATQQVTVSAENVTSANEDMNLAREKSNLGSASILDVLDAQVSLKTAQVNLIRAKLDLNVAIARLQNAMGVSN